MKEVSYNIVVALVISSLGGRRCLYIGRNYGESCEDGETCYGNHVACLVSGLCGCSSPDDMTFDPQSQGCKVNLASSCDSSWDMMDCIQGARCDHGICRCEIGLYASSNQSCLPNKVHNDSCVNDVECGAKLNAEGVTIQRSMVCFNGLCQCDQRIDIYDPIREGCVGLADTDCSDQNSNNVQVGRLCTANAECKNDLLSKRTCQCGSGYAKTSLGRCAKAYGHTCGRLPSQEPCADVHFSCIEGNCTCKYPLHQKYDERTSECLSLVSGPCTFPRDIQMNHTGFHDILKCVKNAHCVDKGFYSDCECQPGFVQTKSGICSPAYGQPCEPGDCDPDGITQLFCRNGRCDCLDLLQVYDTSSKKCRGLVGSRCTTQEPECVEYASCVVPSPPLPGKCLCDKYSTEVLNRTCHYV